LRYRLIMLGLTLLDAIAFGCFALCWIGYSWLVDVVGPRRRGLTSVMAGYRQRWMMEMLTRQNRIVDGQINMTLQQGTAFFASTSLLAVGGGLTLIGATDRAVELVTSLPFGYHPSREQWEVKVAGLTIIFVYAFFKFAWAYRLFNYCAILIGATPDGDRRDSDEAKAMAVRAAKMNAIAAGHFNRGQRAFFFSLAYLGWFAGPLFLIATTVAVVSVIYRRQFCSNSLDAVR
jgi:uncharacterized membrane protein